MYQIDVRDVIYYKYMLIIYQIDVSRINNFSNE